MSVHRYARSALAADYAKAAVGLALSIGLWVLAPDALPAMLISGGLTVLFLLFTLRTVMRQRTVIALGPTAIEGTSALWGRPRVTVFPWSELDAISLRYYSTRRSREGGWMVLKLAAGQRRLTLDSGLDGFDAVAARAAEAARDRGLPLNPSTAANLAALGLGQAEHAFTFAEARAAARAPLARR